MRDYMESMAAHTTVGIKDCQYSIASGNGRKFKILSQKCTELYDYAICSSHVYRNVSIYRHVYYIRNKNIVIIRDEIYSLTDNDFVQYFHIGPELSITTDSQELCVLQNDRCKIYMHQLNPTDTSRIIFANKTIPWSYTSTGFGSVSPTYSVEYIKFGNIVNFVTCIDIREQREGAFTFSLHNNTVLISRDDESLCIPLENKRPLFFNNAFCYINNNKFFTYTVGENHFCCYIFDAKSNHILKSTYSKAKDILALDITNITHGIVIYYNKGEYGDTIYGILAEINKVNDKWIINKFSLPHIPYVTDCGAIWGGTYLVAEVNNEYKFPSQYRWYIYKDSVLFHFEINDSQKFSYEIDTPGKYVVIISISDRYFGEYYFHTFDPISI